MIVCGFPGIGKSFVTKVSHDKYKISDSDSSMFSWLKDDEGKEYKRNPNFIKDYMDYLVKNMEDGYDIIFTSTHPAVLEELSRRKLQFFVVVPLESEKETYLKRYIDRGSDADFITLMNENWTTFNKQCRSELDYKTVINAPEFLTVEFLLSLQSDDIKKCSICEKIIPNTENCLDANGDYICKDCSFIYLMHTCENMNGLDLASKLGLNIIGPDSKNYNKNIVENDPDCEDIVEDNPNWEDQIERTVLLLLESVRTFQFTLLTRLFPGIENTKNFDKNLNDYLRNYIMNDFCYSDILSELESQLKFNSDKVLRFSQLSDKTILDAFALTYSSLVDDHTLAVHNGVINDKMNDLINGFL